MEEKNGTGLFSQVSGLRKEATLDQESNKTK